MKKFITLLAVGAIGVGSLSAQSLATSAVTKGDKTYVKVRVSDLGKLDRGHEYTMDLSGIPTDYKLVGLSYLDNTGKKVRDGVLVGKQSGNTVTLKYNDICHLANGYSLVFSTNDAPAGDDKYNYVTLSETEATVNWSNGTKVSIDKPEGGYVEDSYILVYLKEQVGGSEHKGQLLWFDDGAERKYAWTDEDGHQISSKDDGTTNWAPSGTRSDYQSVWNNWPNKDCHFSFKLVDGVYDKYNDVTLYFTGENFAINKIVYKYPKPAEEGGEAGTTPEGFNALTLTQGGKIEQVSSMTVPGSIVVGMESTVLSGFSDSETAGWKGVDISTAVANKNFKDGDQLIFTLKDAESVQYGQLKVGSKFYGDNLPGGWTNPVSNVNNNTCSFDISEELATALNNVKSGDKDVLFAVGDNSAKAKIAGMSHESTKVENVREGSEYRLLNLWNAREAANVPAHGYDTGIWGFNKGGENTEWWYFGDGANQGNWSTKNDSHDIRKVEEYFAEPDRCSETAKAQWQSEDKVLTPEYWAAVIPRISALQGDKLLLNVEAKNGGQHIMQVWNVKQVDGKLEANIYEWSKPTNNDYKTDLDFTSDKCQYDYKGDARTFMIPLADAGVVDLVKNGLRFKGRDYVIQSIDLIHLNIPEEIEVTEEKGELYIHVLPEHFMKHDNWTAVSFEAPFCKPSKTKDTYHDEKETAHKFTEKMIMNFQLRNSDYNVTDVEYFAYLPGGARFETEQYAEHHTNENPDASVTEDKDKSNVKSFARGGYQPKELTGLFTAGTFYQTLNVADFETYQCQCKDCDPNHNNSAPAITWYKPLANFIESIKAHGLYIRVEYSKATTAANKVRAKAAPQKVEDSILGLTFTPLEGDLADNYILYSFKNPAGDESKLPAVAFDFAGIGNKGNVGTGIENVEDENAPAEYYNIQGMRVDSESLTPGIYVVRQGSKTHKVIIK